MCALLAITLKNYTTNWSPFPPKTSEVQFDEKWDFVGKKQSHCDPENPEDKSLGDCWDHIAIDAESRLLLFLQPGKRTGENVSIVVAEVKARTNGRTDLLLTTDEHGPYATSIEQHYAREVPQVRKPGPGRPPKAKLEMPDDLLYGTVRKIRQNRRVTQVVRTIVFGDQKLLELYLNRSSVSNTINTSFVERNNGTDRSQNSRKARKTYAFSKKLTFHVAAGYFIAYSYNFCWPVRTLARKDSRGTRHQRTPAMAAGLTDHLWAVDEWASFTALPS